jgi:two-component system phosphate regulon sensor histidine kinase PhoR
LGKTVGWFLLGLLLGCLLWGGYFLWLTLKLRRATRSLKIQLTGWPFSSTRRLVRAIVAQDEAYQILQQELETWQHIEDIAPIGFFSVDADNQLTGGNPRACQLLALQPGQLAQPRLLLEIVRSYELDQLIEQTRETQQSQQWDWIFNPVSVDPTQLSQQQSRPLRAVSHPLPKGMVGVFLEDRQETVLLTQQRDRWISDVAHELKTPLTSIRLVAETLQPRLQPPQQEWINRLLREVVRLSHLVQDLLDLSQLESSPTPFLSRQLVDLPQLIQTAWSGLEPLASRKSVWLDNQGENHLQIQADERRLYRVFLNLLDNSIKYSPIGRPVHLSLKVSSDAQEIQIDIFDEGSGFPDYALPYVFDRFYRADDSRTRQGSSDNLSHVAGGIDRYSTAKNPV